MVEVVTVYRKSSITGGAGSLEYNGEGTDMRRRK